MLDWFLDLFTIANLGYFVLGVTATCAYHLVKAHFQDRTVIIKWQYIIVPMAMALVLHVALQTQANADCVREFNERLSIRSKITEENDRLSIEQRELIYDWIHGLIYPPPDIAKLNPNDPVREKYSIDLTIEADKKFDASIKRQHEKLEERAANPLPPGNCGK